MLTSLEYLFTAITSILRQYLKITNFSDSPGVVSPNVTIWDAILWTWLFGLIIAFVKALRFGSSVGSAEKKGD